ncbi:MAG: GNAT family N-acetyltransferase [Gemmatimonadaceae bacterium]
MPDAPPVTHNAAAGRFEAATAHGTALLKYVPRGKALDLVHTEVPPAVEGQGIGMSLARAALEHARTQNVQVIPTCPFVKAYIGKHPEYADLVTAR